MRPIKDLYTNISPILRDRLQQYLNALNTYATAREVAAFQIGCCRQHAEHDSQNGRQRTHETIKRRQREARRNAPAALRLTIADE